MYLYGLLQIIMNSFFQTLKKKQRKELENLKLENLNPYVIKGTEKDWNQALQKNAGIISIKRC